MTSQLTAREGGIENYTGKQKPIQKMEQQLTADNLFTTIKLLYC